MSEFEDHIDRITRDVLTVFGLSVDRVDREPECDGITSWVRISGAWEGMVAVRFSPGLAAVATEALIGFGPGQATQDDVDDVLRELADMIGGNVKALLPEPSKLSLPTVGAAEVGHHERLLSELAFACEGEPLAVALVGTGAS